MIDHDPWAETRTSATADTSRADMSFEETVDTASEVVDTASRVVEELRNLVKMRPNEVWRQNRTARQKEQIEIVASLGSLGKQFAGPLMKIIENSKNPSIASEIVDAVASDPRRPY